MPWNRQPKRLFDVEAMESSAPESEYQRLRDRWGEQIKVEFEKMKGFVLTRIKGKVGDDEMLFHTSTGSTFKLVYERDCCADAHIQDITGDLQDLIGEPILHAELSTSGENPPGVTMEYQDSFTWSFYKLATRKGWVDIRWYGSSNGYYSETVSFYFLPSKTDLIAIELTNGEFAR